MNSDIEILLVDDSPSDVELTIRELRKHRLANQIQVAEDGEEALDFLFRRGRFSNVHGEQPKVILLDIRLPKVDGLEVLQAVRSHEETRAIPVVILTSSKEQQDLIESYKLGVNAYIQKPVDFEQFRKVIREIGMFWLLVNKPLPAAVS
jgi:CheY-like chemotaxis protein